MNTRWMMLFALIACSSKREPSLLREHVDAYCDNLGSELERTKDAMTKLAAYLDGLDASERGEAEAKATHPLTGDFNARLERTDAVLGRFNFCVVIRDTDSANRKRIETRGTSALVRMRGDALDDSRPSYKVMLEALEELVAAVVETNALPLRN